MTTAVSLLRDMIEFIGEHEGWYRGEMGDTYKGSWEENWLANACAVAGVPVPFEPAGRAYGRRRAIKPQEETTR